MALDGRPFCRSRATRTSAAAPIDRYLAARRRPRPATSTTGSRRRRNCRSKQLRIGMEYDHAQSALERLDLVRAGQHPDRAAHRGARSSAAVPDAARQGQVAGQVRARLHHATASRSRGTIWSRATSTPKGHFVVLTKDDFQAAAVEKTRTIDIIDFVEADDDRRSLLRDAVLPGAGEGRRARLRAAARGDPRVGPHRHRQVHPARRAAPRGRRGDRPRARARR